MKMKIALKVQETCEFQAYPISLKQSKIAQISGSATYRGAPLYVHFGTWKKLCYMKFVLEEL